MTPSTFPKIKAGGDAYSFGRQIGERVAAAFKGRVLGHPEFAESAKEWKGSDHVSELSRQARDAFPRYHRELEGMADGAGVDLEDLLIWNFRGDLRFRPGPSPAAEAALAEGCTSVMIPGDAERPGIIAHNEDGAPELDGGCFWLSAQPDGGLAFETFLYPGMLPGNSFAVNAAGLVQAINNIRAHDLKRGIPRHFITRAVLDCRTLDEAVRVISREDRAAGFHHNLGQAGDPRLLSIEAPASGCAVRPVTAPSAHANHLMDERLIDIPQAVTESSSTRQTRADELVAEGASAAADAEAVLADGKILRRPGDGMDDYGRTLATGVFAIEANRVHWTVHHKPEQSNVSDGRVDVG